MDLGKVMLGITAFAVGLCLGGCLEVSALFICICILFGAYFIGTALLNVAERLRDALAELEQQEPEVRKIGYPEIRDLEEEE